MRFTPVFMAVVLCVVLMCASVSCVSNRERARSRLRALAATQLQKEDQDTRFPVQDWTYTNADKPPSWLKPSGQAAKFGLPLTPPPPVPAMPPPPPPTPFPGYSTPSQGQVRSGTGLLTPGQVPYHSYTPPASMYAPEVRAPLADLNPAEAPVVAHNGARPAAMMTRDQLLRADSTDDRAALAAAQNADSQNSVLQDITYRENHGLPSRAVGSPSPPNLPYGLFLPPKQSPLYAPMAPKEKQQG